MIKKIYKNWSLKKREGSSLIVAILVMGILLTLTLGLSNLVIKEIRQTSDLVASGEAYYAAEAGIERAMYELAQAAPGYETVGVDGWVEEDSGEEDLDYQYKIENKGDSIPYFPDDEPIFLSVGEGVAAWTKSSIYNTDDIELLENTYNVLPLNQTVTIPLFTDKGDVDEFMVQYYVNFDVDQENITLIELKNTVIKLEHFDVLRWKVFGNPDYDQNDELDPPVNGVIKTDAISDYFPAHSNDSPSAPVCIGSSQNLTAGSINGATYNCIYPVAKILDPKAPVDALKSWSYARECYHSEAGNIVAPKDPDADNSIVEQCTIKNFVKSHTRNYITLTNVVNPDIIGINPDTTPQFANIYYRVIAKEGGPMLSREFADISADGFARNGTFKQSIDVKLGMSSFLPVFNFSLYRTDTESDK